MAQFITALGANFASVSATTSNSAETLFPDDNCTTNTIFPNRPYKAAGITTSEFVTVDFGTTTSLDAVVIDHINSTSVLVQGNATDSWGAPSYSVAATISQDEADARYKLFHDVTGTGWDTGFRYLRIKKNNGTVTDGSTKWRIGTILGVTTYDSWTYNAGFPYGITPLDGIDLGEKASGGVEPVVLNPDEFCQVRLNTGDFPLTMNDLILQILRTGRARPILFYRNNGSTAEVYITHRRSLVTSNKASANHLNVQTIVLQEVV